ncbi:MAG: SpoIID/LytB domain-containing protein [Clostridia bacterium]|nr:SpoIID/LytB domain-containing protein [Clostridia bacterium]
MSGVKGPRMAFGLFGLDKLHVVILILAAMIISICSMAYGVPSQGVQGGSNTPPPTDDVDSSGGVAPVVNTPHSPMIRVGIVSNGIGAQLAPGSPMALGSTSSLAPLVVAGTIRTQVAMFEPGANGGIVYVGEDENRIAMESPVKVELDCGSLSAVAFIWLGNQASIYRGSFEVISRAGGGLTAVNIVEIDDYLVGVVPYEIGSGAPFEALMAQAVVSRTEALGSLGRHKADGYDLCSGTHCQVYAGASREGAYPEVRRAVMATRGETLYYNGVPAKSAKFHACCGGITENAGSIWKTDTPYMRSVRCLRGEEESPAQAELEISGEDALRRYIRLPNPNDCCYGSNGYRWKASYTPAEFSAVIERTLGKKADILGVRVNLRTPRGAAMQVTVHTSIGDLQLDGEYAIRTALGGTTVIKSGVFVVNVETAQGKEGAAPIRFEFEGAGYGHGVGMCQYGACAMAKAGCDYRGILERYYPGASVGGGFASITEAR